MTFLNGKGLPPLIFHVFGDFSLNCREWISIEDNLLGEKVEFVVSSNAQARLLGLFLKHRETPPPVVPFPVNEKVFFHNVDCAKNWRERIWPGDGKIFLYTGRLSEQKNIQHLIYAFNAYIIKSSYFAGKEINSKLIICGDYDDLGTPFSSLQRLPFTYFHSLNKGLALLPEATRSKIYFLGNCSHEELRSIYNASDYYISLSTHHDEDFGMSPAEALCTGLPCILTSWGGFNSFRLKGLEDFVKYIPVDLEQGRPQIDLTALVRALLKTSLENYPDDYRLNVSKEYHKLFSISGAASKLEELHKYEVPRFEGFSHTFKKLARVYDLNREAPFRSYIGEENGIKNLYTELYQSYLGV